MMPFLYLNHKPLLLFRIYSPYRLVLVSFHKKKLYDKILDMND